ncbi:MAG: phosphotransferase [Defluviitaleaceae bacterium]|nr:phosphotransferase [Defluviitaleaceae bacterium]
MDFRITNITKLSGGSVGHVELATGIYKNKPLKVVIKTQKKWERPGDPNSWRREYDLYTSNFDEIFTSNLRWPKCYHSEINDNETKLWLEYIEGVSDADLTMEMYEKIAEGLGHFHGRLYSEKFTITTENLTDTDSMKNFYHYNRSRANADCKVPSHLQKMLSDMDNNSDNIWAEIEKLPIVLRHGDFFPPNMFYTDGKIILIDWDSAGWSYLGEDIVNMVADVDDTDNMVDYFNKCVPAYRRGFSEYSTVENLYIYERVIMHFGHRLVSGFNWRGEEKTPDEQKNDLVVLQKIYEMGK